MKYVTVILISYLEKVEIYLIHSLNNFKLFILNSSIQIRKRILF